MEHQHKHKTDIAARLMDETGYNRIAIFADEIGHVHYRIKGSDAEIAALKEEGVQGSGIGKNGNYMNLNIFS